MKQADKIAIARPRFACRGAFSAPVRFGQVGRKPSRPYLRSPKSSISTPRARSSIKAPTISGACANSRPRCAPIWRRAERSETPSSIVRQTPVRLVTSIQINCSTRRRRPAPAICSISSFHKLSTLVQWAKFDIVEVKSRNVVFIVSSPSAATMTRPGAMRNPSSSGKSWIMRNVEANCMRRAAITAPRKPRSAAPGCSSS